jgi:predicted ATPase/DNA-binding SARP family transcriptional activator
MRVVIRMLGGFSVSVDDRPVPDAAWQRRSASALVKLLALQPNRRMRREQVIDALWPDRLVDDAAPQLHKAAHYARSALGTRDAVVLAREVVTLLPAERVSVDVVDFEAAAAAATDARSATEAADRYAGELLPDDLFDPWTEEPRVRLRRRYRELLRSAGRWTELVAVDPVDEEAHLALAREHLEHRRPQAALRQLDELTGVLRRELGAAPGKSAEAMRARALAMPVEPVAYAAVPALRATPLPLLPTETVGRQRDLERVGQLLQRSRLVTLLGPGGVGKTRLAIEAAGQQVRDTGMEVCFVDLTKMTDPALVADLVARELGAHAGSAGDAERAVAEALRSRELLLVLDNFEHVAEAAGLVSRLLRLSAGLWVLCTSRVRLHLAGEQLYDVPPLSLAPVPRGPAPGQGLPPPAVALFAQAAAAVDPDFTLAAHGPDVAAICRAVDGLPLAIELAAGHVRTFPPALLRRRLDVRLGSPVGAAVDSHPRQRTVAATIDWSLQLLGESERRLFARLGVFAGAVPIEAIESVCGAPGLDPATALTRLVDASLVRRMPGRRGGLRFGLLQLLRERARILLQDDEMAELSARHATWVVSAVEEAEEQRWTDVGGPWIDRVADLLPEIRAAHDWAQRHDRPLAARLTAAMGVYWQREGHHAEARVWAEDALARPAELDDLLVARLHLAAGWVERSTNLEGARQHWSTAIERFRALGHQRYLACALVWRSVGYVHDPDHYDVARELGEEGIRRARAVGERGLLIQALNVRGELARAHGDDDVALAHYQEACALAAECGDDTGLSVYLSNLAYLAARRDDWAEARRLACDALQRARALGRRMTTAWVVSQLAGPELALGRPELGAQLLGAADRALDVLGASLDLCDLPEHERVVAALHAALGDAGYDRQHAEGSRLSLDQAAELALGSAMQTTGG